MSHEAHSSANRDKLKLVARERLERDLDLLDAEQRRDDAAGADELFCTLETVSRLLRWLAGVDRKTNPSCRGLRSGRA